MSASFEGLIAQLPGGGSIKFCPSRRCSQPLAAFRLRCSKAILSVDHKQMLARPFGVAELDVRLPDTALQLPFPTGIRLRRINRAIKERA